MTSLLLSRGGFSLSATRWWNIPNSFVKPIGMKGFSPSLSVVEVGLVGEGRAKVAKHVLSSLSVPQAAHARSR